MRLYRDFISQEALDRAYDPRSTASDADAVQARWAAMSAAALAGPGVRPGLRYGATLAEFLDFFPAGGGAPLHVFIHGGYWRRFSAGDFAFVGAAMRDQGISAAIVNYELCPKVTIEEIVRQVRAAIAWCSTHVATLGCDPARLTISGHSAGGHLAAMALATDWAGGYGLPARLIGGAVLVSGLYDLAPFPYSYLQPALQLRWEEVRRCSPLLLDPPEDVPAVVAVGSRETAEFIRQSRSYARHLDGQDGACLLEVDADHFDILEGMVDPRQPLGQAWRRIVEGRAP